jgi:hypothetical protein
LKAGSIGVPDYSSGEMKEGYDTKHEEAETKLKGKLELDRSHVERPKLATTIMLLVLKNTRKDVK